MDESWSPTMKTFAAVALLALGAALIGSTAHGATASTPFRVSCADFGGVVKNPREGGYRVLLGAISVPSENSPNGTVRVGGRWPYWSKAGIFVRPGKFTVTVGVPKRWRSRAAITWGNSHRIVSALQFSGCETGGGTTPYWSGYAGGFYLRSRAACVPLIFSIGHRSTTAFFNVGRSCR